MRKIVNCLLVILCFPIVSSGQRNSSPEAPTDSIQQLVVRLYNAGNSHAIYDLGDSSFQHFISRQHFVPWINQLKNDLGNVLHAERTGYSNGFYIYKTMFRNGVMNMLLAVNASAELTGFAVRPGSKTAVVASDNPLNNKVDSLVEEVIRRYIQQYNTVGLSAGIVVDGRSYIYNYGEVMKGSGNLPDENTIYEIGSVTKTFTATLLALFALERKCHLDDPVNRFLPASVPTLQKDDSVVTLKMLANHTSGLPRIPSDLFSDSEADTHDPYANYDTTHLYHELESVRLASVPGTNWAYSNLGFGLLGTILTRISDHSYASLLEQYICQPLGMDNTRMALNEDQKKREAQGYLEDGQPAHYWHFKAMAGAGAIRSSVADMLKYLKAHLHPGNTALGTAIMLTEAPTYTTKDIQMGLGWISLSGNPQTYWHDGGTGGFRSFIAYNRDRQAAIVILSNAAVQVDAPGTELIKGLLQLK